MKFEVDATDELGDDVVSSVVGATDEKIESPENPEREQLLCDAVIERDGDGGT